MLDRQRPREVGEEDHARLERRHQHGIPAGVRLRELGAEFADPLGDLLSREIDGPDRVALLPQRIEHQAAGLRTPASGDSAVRAARCRGGRTASP